MKQWFTWFTREPRTPAYDEISTLVQCAPGTVPYRYVTQGTWTRNGSKPATCVTCLAQHHLMLGWLEGHENRAYFHCPCGTSWCDPLWARLEATTDVRTSSRYTPIGENP